MATDLFVFVVAYFASLGRGFHGVGSMSIDPLNAMFTPVSARMYAVSVIGTLTVMSSKYAILLSSLGIMAFSRSGEIGKGLYPGIQTFSEHVEMPFGSTIFEDVVPNKDSER